MQYTRVGQSIESSDVDLLAAPFAQAEGALLELGNRQLDPGQFPGVQFGQLGGHLVASGLEGHVGGIAGGIGAEPAQVRPLSGQLFHQRIAPAEQSLMQSQ